VYLILDRIGPGKFLGGHLPLLAPFTVTCPECGKDHSYRSKDVEERSVENPPLTPCVPFLDAIAKAAWPDSDTAGFSDDDNACGGVFWHREGYILGRDGRKRDIEPDLPGWYYWYEGPDHFRYLHGPCSTKAEAEFNLEVNIE
jgi:hypothetical protein